MFELWIAVTVAGCKLDLIMPPSEGERFNETLVSNFDHIAMVLSKVPKPPLFFITRCSSRVLVL